MCCSVRDVVESGESVNDIITQRVRERARERERERERERARAAIDNTQLGCGIQALIITQPISISVI